MLFNSFEFLFFFLPVVVISFYALGSIARLLAIGWLALASLAFYVLPFMLYGDYGWLPTALLCASVLFNYGAGLAVMRYRSTWLMGTAIAVDLGVLAYFKYSGFLINFTTWFGGAIPWQVLLPIGFSFYTFTQIAFLVDAYQGKVSIPAS